MKFYSSIPKDMNFDYLDDEEEVIDPEAKVIVKLNKIYNENFELILFVLIILLKEPKKTFRERLAEIQEICLKVQETLDFIASLGERVIK